LNLKTNVISSLYSITSLKGKLKQHQVLLNWIERQRRELIDDGVSTSQNFSSRRSTRVDAAKKSAQSRLLRLRSEKKESSKNERFASYLANDEKVNRRFQNCWAQKRRSSLDQEWNARSSSSRSLITSLQGRLKKINRTTEEHDETVIVEKQTSTNWREVFAHVDFEQEIEAITEFLSELQLRIDSEIQRKHTAKKKKKESTKEIRERKVQVFVQDKFCSRWVMTVLWQTLNTLQKWSKYHTDRQC
jgi:hypothetical protein